MSTTIHNSFDPLVYLDKLKEAGVPEAQARVQVELASQQTKAVQEAIEKQAATREDLKELELRLVKWQAGLAFAGFAIMAKGFGWLGF